MINFRKFSRSARMLLIALVCIAGVSTYAHENRRMESANILPPGGILHVNESIQSHDGRNYIVLQPDGNFVLYNRSSGTKATWSSNTERSEANILAMQGDGNLVLYDANWNAIWSSQTQGNNGAYLKVQDDGNLVIYRMGSNGSSGAVWSSKTNGNY